MNLDFILTYVLYAAVILLFISILAFITSDVAVGFVRSL
jgi:hypothetical protein